MYQLCKWPHKIRSVVSYEYNVSLDLKAIKTCRNRLLCVLVLMLNKSSSSSGANVEGKVICMGAGYSV